MDVAWNIHILCDLSCGIITCETGIRIVATHTIAMNGTHVGTNVQITFVIHQQLTYKNMLNSVHNCESHIQNALINSRINYQVDSACIRNILIMALTIVVSSCSVQV